MAVDLYKALMEEGKNVPESCKKCDVYNYGLSPSDWCGDCGGAVTIFYDDDDFDDDEDYDDYLNSLGVNVEKCEEEQCDDWVEKYLV